MVYIDFTSPEGKTYRIDVEKNHIIYECPVCGEKTEFIFDPNINYCESCDRREEEKKRAEMDERSKRQLAEYLNRKYRSNLNSKDIEQLFAEANNAEDPNKKIEEFVRKLEENKPRKKRCSTRLPSGIIRIEPSNDYNLTLKK